MLERQNERSRDNQQVRDRGSIWSRLEGAAQAVRGLFEMVGGACIAVYSGGFLSFAGGALFTYGADEYATGMRKVFSGEHVDTALAQGLQMTGMSTEASRLVADGIGIGLSLGTAVALKSGIHAAESTLTKIGTQVNKPPRSAITSSTSKTVGKAAEYTKNNYRANLKKLTGISPPSNVHAHHVFPQKYRAQFADKGINIDDPKYLAWWEKGSHQMNARSYNREWELFMDKYPNATKIQIEEKGKDIMFRYGMKTNY